MRENATTRTKSVCSSKVAIGCPVCRFHRRTVSSALALAIVPFTETATELTASVWPRRTCRADPPVAAFQMRRVLSRLPLTNVLSAVKATDVTKLVCPMRAPIGTPVVASQRRMVLSRPELARSPVPENATLNTQPPCRPMMRFVPVCVSQSRTVLSRPPLASCPVLENAIAYI